MEWKKSFRGRGYWSKVKGISILVSDVYPKKTAKFPNTQLDWQKKSLKVGDLMHNWNNNFQLSKTFKTILLISPFYARC